MRRSNSMRSLSIRSEPGNRPMDQMSNSFPNQHFQNGPPHGHNGPMGGQRPMGGQGPMGGPGQMHPQMNGLQRGHGATQSFRGHPEQDGVIIM